MIKITKKEWEKMKGIVESERWLSLNQWILDIEAQAAVEQFGKSCKTVEVEIAVIGESKHKLKLTGQELSPTWAITPRIDSNSRPALGRFQLTHRPSGLRAAGTKTRKSLLKFWQEIPAWVKARLETDAINKITEIGCFVSNCRALNRDASAIIEWPESEEAWKKERQGE